MVDQETHYKQILESIITIFRKAFYCETEEDLSKKCLEVAEALTNSKFGFIGEINDSGKINSIAISNPGWDACSIDGDRTKLLINMELKGIWALPIGSGKSVIINSPSSHPASIGVPDGHPPLLSFIGVPLFKNNNVIGVMALANKEGGYSERDKICLEKFSIAVVESIMKKRAESKLVEYNKCLIQKTTELEKKINELEQRDKTLASLRELLNISKKVEEKTKK